MKVKINDIEVKTDFNIRLDPKAPSTLLINEDLILATCVLPGQAINVLGALRAIRLDAMFEMAKTIYELISTSEFASQPDEMIQVAIDAMTIAEGDRYVTGSHCNELKNMQALLDARKVMADIQYEWDNQ